MYIVTNLLGEKGVQTGGWVADAPGKGKRRAAPQKGAVKVDRTVYVVVQSIERRNGDKRTTSFGLLNELFRGVGGERLG